MKTQVPYFSEKCNKIDTNIKKDIHPTNKGKIKDNCSIIFLNLFSLKERYRYTINLFKTKYKKMRITKYPS